VWWTQGHTFTTSARVLNLQNYDMVLGMDWLEQFSPMWIHWKKKTMRFNHNSKRILLHGVKDCTSSCPPLNARKLKGMLKKGSVQHLVQLSPVSAMDAQPDLPAAVRILVQANADLFHKPTGLPPQRCADHQIPLVHGAQAVNSRPYRYTPAQKDEIEKQVKEMLQNGVISLVLVHSPHQYSWSRKRMDPGDSALTIGGSIPSLSRTNTPCQLWMSFWMN
jgi:hypothetical protein